MLSLIPVMAFFLLPGPARGEGTRILASTRQDSKVEGVLALERVPMETPYGRMDLPVRMIQRIEFLGEGSEARAYLANGDHLTGVISLDAWQIDSEFGPLRVESARLREIRIRRSSTSASAKGLLLANGMGSPEELAGGEAGPPGRKTAGTFVEGVRGRGVEIGPGSRECLIFDQVPVNGMQGCISVWARIQQPEGIGTGGPAFVQGGGANPGLFRLLAGDGEYMLMFSGNDGRGQAGLCGNADWIGSAGSGGFDAGWTFDKALSGLNVAEWHHYALAWSNEGLPGLPHRAMMFVDGKPTGRSWMSTIGRSPAVNPATTGQLVVQSGTPLRNMRVAFDEIRVWNYAKTDFTDEMER